MSGTSTNQTAAYAQAAKLFEDGHFHLPVQQTFGLSAAGDAHAASEAGHVTGRLIIAVD